jgi:hypothetical protein
MWPRARAKGSPGGRRSANCLRDARSRGRELAPGAGGQDRVDLHDHAFHLIVRRNTFVIRVEGQIYNVTLNSEPVITNFTGNRAMRGHIGLQNHSPKDQVFFRNIIATPL